MGRTLLDKIWDAHTVRVEDGGRCVLYIDCSSSLFSGVNTLTSTMMPYAPWGTRREVSRTSPFEFHR